MTRTEESESERSQSINAKSSVFLSEVTTELAETEQDESEGENQDGNFNDMLRSLELSDKEAVGIIGQFFSKSETRKKKTNMHRSTL